MSGLLAELGAAGQVEAKGGFTIDPEKAREKLRQYQLADPYRYVLLVVEAAVSCGADTIEFEIDSDDLHARFAGTSFGFEQLENIYGSLFSSIGEVAASELARLRGLQQLAYALNSAMALNPRYVRVVSVGADGIGARLELRPDAPDQVEAIEGDGPPPGNWIHVKDRFRPGLVLEFFRSIRGNLAEITLLREHCRWARASVIVNGTQVSGPIEFEREHWTAVDVFDGSGGPGEERVCIGRAALGLVDSEGTLDKPHADLLSNGVFIERVPIPAAIGGGARGFAAIVDSPRFGKDVSQTKLLRDQGYEAVMLAIRAAQDQTIMRLAERCAVEAGPRWGHAVLRAWLLSNQFGGLRRALREHPVFACVAEVPLWPVIGAANITTRTLIESDEPIRYARDSFEFAPLDVPFVLALGDDLDGELFGLLAKLFQRNMQDYTAAVQREHERQRNRLEFMARTHLTELGAGHYLIRETIETKFRDGDRVTPIRGEVGLRRTVGQCDSWIRLLCEGCLLQEVPIDGPIPGLCAVVHAELMPSHSYDEAVATPALAAALVAVLEALARAVVHLSVSALAIPQRAAIRELLRIYVQQVMQGDYAVALLMQFGFKRSHARRELGRLLDATESSIRPRWDLDRPTNERHVLTEVPLYPCVGDEPRSLADLHARISAGERVAWLETGTASIPPLDDEVMLLERGDRATLRALLGAEALAPYAERLAWIRRRDAFLARPKARLELGHRTLVETPIEGTIETAELRGALGLREFAFSEVGDGATPVRVFLHGRALYEFKLDLPLPGLVAWVESAEFETSPEFDALAHPLALRRPLLQALISLIDVEIARAQTQPRALRRCEWWLLAMIPNLVFGTGSLGSAFLQLRRARGQAQALLDLDGLLALLERFPERDLERAYGRLRGRDELPTPEAIEGQCRRPSRSPSRAEQDLLFVRRGLLARLEALFDLRSIRPFTGPAVDGNTPRAVKLGALYDRVAGGQPVGWVGEEFRIKSMPSVEFEVVGLDPVEQRLLQDLFGLSALEQVDAWLEGRAKFERRRTIDEVRVPRGAALNIIERSGPGWRGEFGIAREAPRSDQRSKIRLFTDKREAAILDLPAKLVAMVGVIEFDELALTDRFDDVTRDERERVRKIVDGGTNSLLRDLAARYRDFRSADRALAAQIVRHLLVRWPPGHGGYAARAKQRPKTFEQLAGLPVFAGARKPWSAIELAGASKRGSLATIGYRKNTALPDIPIVVLDAEDVERTLRTLFGETRDLYEELERTRALAARKASAPPMPSRAPAGALAKIEIDEERLRGWLWISPGHTEVMFGEDGRAVSKRTVSPLCPCAGAIWGEGLSITPDWTGVTVSRSQERMLERRAVMLWSGLLDEYLNETARRQRLVSIRDGLRNLFMTLHGAIGHKRKHGRGNRYERLYARAWEAPLLELSTGRWISAEVAERERPAELAGLGLWTGPSAAELAQQRAAKRRESERAREQERRDQQEAEAARRRAAAEAREREAERRRKAARAAERRAKQDREASEREAAAAKAARKAAQAPASPSPEQLLLEAVREELRLVRAGNRGLVSNHHLESLVLGEPVRRGSLFRHVPSSRGGDGRLEIDTGHPLFVATLAAYLDDQTLLTLLASAAYTYLNLIYVEIADTDEAEFLRRHASHATTSIS